MIPKYHILLGFITSFLLVYFLELSLLLGAVIFISSFLIDIDHYFWYAFYKKDLNPINSIKWFYNLVEKNKKLSKQEKRALKYHILIFHGIEFWVILFLLGFFLSPIFYFILIGVGIHMILDWTHTIFYKEESLVKFSQIYVLIRNKNKKNIINL